MNVYVSYEPRYVGLKYFTVSRYYLGLKIHCNIAERNSVTSLTGMNVNNDVGIYIIYLAPSYHADCFNDREYLLDPGLDSLIFGQ
jgi:hypothetical protein